MHGFDVYRHILLVVPKRTYVGRHIAWCETNPTSMIEIHPVWRRWRELAPMKERGLSPCDDRPGVRVGCRLACGVTGFELGEGCVDVVEIETDTRRSPVVGADL